MPRQGEKTMINSRFKFRLWDRKNKVMLYEHSKELDNYDRDESYFSMESYIFYIINHFATSEDYVLMQCTGQKDVNDTDIFEGDIVKFGIDVDDIGVIKWDADNSRFIIDEIFNNNISDFTNWYGKDLEIDGNIYEDERFKQE